MLPANVEALNSVIPMVGGKHPDTLEKKEWYEAQGVDKDGIMEELSHQQISPALMRFINEGEGPQVLDAAQFFPVMMMEAQTSPYTPEVPTFIFAQQIKHGGKVYQRRKKTKHKQSDTHAARSELVFPFPTAFRRMSRCCGGFANACDRSSPEREQMNKSRAQKHDR